jgi:predicted TIM-barrel fold metal-dependent hydrolase
MGTKCPCCAVCNSSSHFNDRNPAWAISSFGKHGFAGVKLYPQLGFDPWPASTEERQKNEYLYSYCAKKQIPITTHCSDGGFAVCDEAAAFTNPARWRLVLQAFPELKINFAHMGKQSKKKFILFSQTAWQKEVLALIAEYPNTFADFSCTAFDDKFYRALKQLLAGQPHICNRILFGSDFMINLLWCNSYNDYLKLFLQNKHLTKKEKQALCVG